MRLALFEPDIPQNTGTLIRLGACLNVRIDIIEPCGFAISDRALRRSGMDYLDLATLTIHASWAAFSETLEGERLILLTTKGETLYTEFAFDPDDVLLLGRESAGVPAYVHERADERLKVPMAPEARSLNIAVSAAIVVGEALRQTGSFPS